MCGAAARGAVARRKWVSAKRQGKTRQAGRQAVQCSAVQAGEELQADKQCRQTEGGEENEEEEEEEGQCRR